MKLKSFLISFSFIFSMVMCSVAQIHAGIVEDKALLKAASQGDLQEVKKWLNTGADVNVVDNSGDTALMYAVYFGHTEVAKLLIKNNVDVNHANNLGDTALMYAAIEGYTEVAELLIKNNADVNHANIKFGSTALVPAIGLGHTEIAELLIKNNADVNHANYAGNTALIPAIIFSQTEAAELLIKNNADLNVVNKTATPLMDAAHFGRTEIVKLLLDPNLSPKRRANVNIRDENGKTAYDYAKEKGHKEIMELIESQKLPPKNCGMNNNNNYNY